MADPIVELYRGGRDALGRSLEDMWEYDHVALEEHHDFIQFLFPSDQPSMFQDAPLVTADTRKAFAGDAGMRANLGRSLDVMLNFYGLRFDHTSGRVERGDNFAERARNWLASPNHNFLRVTRILRSLTLLGLPDRAAALLACLEDLYREYGGVIGDSVRYWRGALM
jgi:Opioid growth factor receptor (OGFr) conserved region